MGFFEFFGVLTFFYYLVSALLWLTLDSDIELFIKEKFGKSICKYKAAHNFEINLIAMKYI